METVDYTRPGSRSGSCGRRRRSRVRPRRSAGSSRSATPTSRPCGGSCALNPGATPLLAGAYVRDSLVATTDERLYVLIPRSRSTGPRHLGRRRAGSARFGPRGAIAAPVASLDQFRSPAARSTGWTDRWDTERVTSLTRRERATRRDRCPRPVPLIRQPIR